MNFFESFNVEENYKVKNDRVIKEKSEKNEKFERGRQIQ